MARFKDITTDEMETLKLYANAFASIYRSRKNSWIRFINVITDLQNYLKRRNINLYSQWNDNMWSEEMETINKPYGSSWEALEKSFPEYSANQLGRFIADMLRERIARALVKDRFAFFHTAN